jgi:hypothetical protein
VRIRGKKLKKGSGFRMAIKLTDLYKIESDEFLAVETSHRTPPKTSGNSVGKVSTSKLDLLTLTGSLSVSQNKIAKLAGVKRWVVNHLLKGRHYKNSSPQQKLIEWLFNNGFRNCFKTKEKAASCTCPHCGAKHRAVPLFKRRV